ncbi:hypothetical protein SAMN05421823_11344 [Catalinimonas alkaloidigena]|uniref:Uncharacterized protein n=1 Tax=Catalinimonas alkaloidigena TaxID=1075417 RepID=A0A1G9SZX4_9BACT|nr:hypothetical protein [Catalinimonas alkaloidigena]SDM40927.1 hypothetical protein SAMN05421823_11344 [Catalinimonas alkaloidigena]
MATQEKNYTKQLETTIESLRSNDFSEKARPFINEWLDVLKESDDVLLKTLTRELESLKQLLGSKQPDKQELSHLLHDIGEHTLEIAATTRGDLGNELRKLGDAIKLSSSKIK